MKERERRLPLISLPNWSRQSYCIDGGQNPAGDRLDLRFRTRTDCVRQGIPRIKELVCAEYNISEDELISDVRLQRFAEPRQVGVYLCRELLDSTYADIAREFGGKHHSTVMHAWKRIRDRIVNETSLLAIIQHLKSEAACGVAV